MKRLTLIIAALSALLLFSCQEKEEIIVPMNQPEGYQDFLAAQRLGVTYYECAVLSKEVRITLETEKELSLDVSGLEFEDCTASAPRAVSYDDNGFCLVGGKKTGYRRDFSRKDDNAFPFYVYLSTTGVHMRLTNGNHLLVQYKKKEEPAPQQPVNPDPEPEVKKSLPVIYLTTDDGKAITSKTVYKPGTVEFHDPDHKYWSMDVFSMKMEIRGRGNSTWDPWGKPKLPYMFKLDEKVRVFNMSYDKSWVLLSNWVDKSLLRNRVCFELSKILGFSWTPKAVPVEVYLNGDYVGLYDFVEHKKVSTERVNIDTKNGDIYFEIESNMDETACWQTEHGHPMMFKDPENPTAEQIAYAKQFFKDFEDALWNKEFQKVYDQYIDLDSFINYFIVEEFSKDVDGNLRKSTFLTLKKGGKLEMYHVWDFDISLGNCDYYGDGNQPWEGWWTKTQNMWGYGHGWYYRLFMDPTFTQKVKDRWNAVYPQFKAFYDQIDVMVEEMGDAPQRNHDRWGRLNTYDWPQYKVTGSYQGEVDWLKENYRKRLDWMNTNINAL